MNIKRITMKTRPVSRRTQQLKYRGYLEEPLLKDKALYLPPGSLFFDGLGCLEVTLKLSEVAPGLYAQAVETLELPGCQAILSEALQHSGDMRKVLRKILRHLDKAIKDPPPEPGEAILSAIANRLQSNTDFQTYADKIRGLILVGFNRSDENTRERPKVVMDKAPDLVTAIVVRSLYDHHRLAEQFDLGRLTQYAPGVASIMAKPHPPRREQRIKHAIITSYKSWKFKLEHDTTILDRAWKWYQCRVIYAGPEEFCRRYYNSAGIWYDPANVDKEIAFPDKATGYPRKRRE